MLTTGAVYRKPETNPGGNTSSRKAARHPGGQSSPEAPPGPGTAPFQPATDPVGRIILQLPEHEQAGWADPGSVGRARPWPASRPPRPRRMSTPPAAPPCGYPRAGQIRPGRGRSSGRLPPRRPPGLRVRCRPYPLTLAGKGYPGNQRGSARDWRNSVVGISIPGRALIAWVLNPNPFCRLLPRGRARRDQTTQLGS